MARVWYVGTYPYREITPQDWDKVGLFGPHFQWSSDNGWSVEQENFRPAHLTYLAGDPEFLLDQVGTRPDTPVPPDDVTRPYKADASILKLVDDAFEALGLAEDALGDIQDSVSAANSAANLSGVYRNESQGFRNEAEGFKNTAGTSASSASTSAATAGTKAGEASVSAAAGKTSEDNAKESENNAKTSENNAKDSEDRARASEGNAATSESNAAGSASTAVSKANEASISAATLVQRVSRGGKEIDYLPDGRPYLLDPAEVEEVPLRVDKTVGTRVFLGDLMIHGDTGWRMLGEGDLSNGWSVHNASVGLQVRRIGDIVQLYMPSLGLDGINSTSGGFFNAPSGFRPAFNYASFGNVFTSAGAQHRIAQDTSYIVVVGAPKAQVTGNIWWRTSQPWPTSLPGTPI